MASYTMQLRDYIEHFSQEETGLSSREQIEKGRTKLFDFDYPIFDKDYKKIFETNFIRNFYMREIGFETEGLFKFQLETWLLINMPYYNKLFESELIKFNPLESYSLKTTYQRTNDTKKDDNRNMQQHDNKTVKQKDSSSNLITENDSRTQDDINTRIQNERNVKNQSDQRDVTQNDETNTQQNVNTITDTTNTQNENVSRETNTETELTNETTTDKNATGKTTDAHDNFNRQLDSDTPDTRLQLTTKDGEGVIEYASSIKENNENNKTTSNSEMDEKQSEKSDSLGLTSVNENGETTVDGVTHADTTVKNDETSTLESKLNDRLSSNVTDTLDGTTTDTLNSRLNGQKTNNQSGTLTSDTTDELSSNINDVASSKINDIEDYIEERVGSIGVKTYSEMINEYRSILLRIEKQIFKEMNELFMLVY